MVGFVEGYEEMDPSRQRVERKREGNVVYERRAKKEGKRGREKTYKGCSRTFIRFGRERGTRAEAWSLKGGVTAFDVELSALVRGIELCYLQASPGADFRIFTDSQAAMRRLQDDRPGPGQQMAARGIIGATEAYKKGASISVNWVPGHAGVLENEVADQWAVDAEMREMRASRGGDASQAALRPDRMMSRSFLKSTLRKRAVSSWRDEIRQRGKGGRQYRIPREGEVPRIPRALQRTNKELASRFFQLASGHAMIAPFLKERFGWVESDLCWWCCIGRQSREHLFKSAGHARRKSGCFGKRLGTSQERPGSSREKQGGEERVYVRVNKGEDRTRQLLCWKAVRRFAFY